MVTNYRYLSIWEHPSWSIFPHRLFVIWAQNCQVPQTCCAINNSLDQFNPLQPKSVQTTNKLKYTVLITLECVNCIDSYFCFCIWFTVILSPGRIKLCLNPIILWGSLEKLGFCVWSACMCIRECNNSMKKNQTRVLWDPFQTITFKISHKLLYTRAPLPPGNKPPSTKMYAVSFSATRLPHFSFNRRRPLLQTFCSTFLSQLQCFSCSFTQNHADSEAGPFKSQQKNPPFTPAQRGKDKTATGKCPNESSACSQPRKGQS